MGLDLTSIFVSYCGFINRLLPVSAQGIRNMYTSVER